jgi:hypothetical protein
MIKKAIAAVIAAGALSVPLAGMAWAEPLSDPGSNDNGIGQGGLPQKLGTFVDTGIKPKDPQTTPPSLNRGRPDPSWQGVHQTVNRVAGQHAWCCWGFESFGRHTRSQTEPLFRAIRRNGGTSLQA